MAYVTTSILDSVLDLPVSLPLTDLYPDEWLIVSTVSIASPRAFTVRWLQVHLVQLVDPSLQEGSVILPNSAGTCDIPSQVPVIVTPNQGLAWLGLYRNFDPMKLPSFQAAQEAVLQIGDATTVPPIYVARSLTPTTYAAAGSYSFVIVNNTSNRMLRLAVTGQVRLNLGFSST